MFTVTRHRDAISFNKQHRRRAMPVVFWDIETRSKLALETVGAWRYAADPTTEVL